MHILLHASSWQVVSGTTSYSRYAFRAGQFKDSLAFNKNVLGECFECNELLMYFLCGQRTSTNFPIS